MMWPGYAIILVVSERAGYSGIDRKDNSSAAAASSWQIYELSIQELLALLSFFSKTWQLIGNLSGKNLVRIGKRFSAWPRQEPTAVEKRQIFANPSQPSRLPRIFKTSVETASFVGTSKIFYLFFLYFCHTRKFWPCSVNQKNLILFGAIF